MIHSDRILIVEDEPSVRLVLRTALESPGLELATAEDGEAALEALKKAPAELVLLDLRMPNLDGMALLTRLRAEGNDVPVVIIPAHGSVPDAVTAMKLGPLDFLGKPLTPEVLRAALQDVLARHARPRKPVPEPSREAPAPVGQADGLMSRAKQALNHRQFDHAESLLSQAAREHRSAESHYLLGVLHEMRDWPDAAYAAYRAAGRLGVQAREAPPDEVLQRPPHVKGGRPRPSPRTPRAGAVRPDHGWQPLLTRKPGETNRCST